MNKSAIQLLIDISYRVPLKKIVLTTDGYYLFDTFGLNRVKINISDINELIDNNYLSSIKHNGYIQYIPTNKSFDECTSYLEKIDGKNHHGQAIKINVLPPYYGE